MITLRSLACFGLILLCVRSSQAQLPPTLRETFKTFCFDCHDDANPQAKLSLESLSSAGPDVSPAVWARVYDKLVTREMPPVDMPQPTPEQRQELTNWLHNALHSTSLHQQQHDGRVVMRRMNAGEYENTLRDLLDISVELKTLLPQDTMTAGFDKVSAGLDTSASHLVLYQQAADKAIAATCNRPNRIDPARNGVVRTTAAERWAAWRPTDREDQRLSADLHQRYSARMDGETIVFHQQTESNQFLEMEFGEPLQPGRYRIRAKVAAKNTDGKPLPVLIFRVGIAREFNFNNARVIAVLNAPADTPTVIEHEFLVTDDPNLSLNKRIALKGWSLPNQKHPDDIRRDMAAGIAPNFSGPGLAVEWAEMEGPLNDRRGYQLLFGDLPLAPRGRESEPEEHWRHWHPNEFVKYPLEPQSVDPGNDAERLIRSFLPVAFRRPVDEQTASSFVQFAHERLRSGYSFADAMRAAYRNILCSPRFFMLIEKPGPLDDFALACRLSFFLWSSSPDSTLLSLAAKGELHQPEVLRREVDRMLADDKAARFTESFTDQWLDLYKLHMTKPDVRYVEFDDHLLWSMPLETKAFFNEMLRFDRPVAEFVSSDWTFLDSRLAQHYGLADVNSWELQKTKLPSDAHRGGVMTQAAILKVTANGTTTSPILRGKWVLEKLVGNPPSPPPPDIPALEPDIRGATTIREQLDKHRNLPACATCHAKIDPPGFALETYDVIGGWREWYRAGQDGIGGKERVALTNYPEFEVWRGPDVEQGFTTADGRPFRDIDEYRRILLEDRDQLARNVTEKLLIYATGADVQFADREVIEQIVHETRASNHGLRSILHAVVQSRCFLNK
jgi:hypothetical protein